MAETNKVKKQIPLKLHQEFAVLYFRKKRLKPGKKFKFEESYKELTEKVKSHDGLTAKADKTISVKGKIFRLTKDYPNPKDIETTIKALHTKAVAEKILNELFKL